MKVCITKMTINPDMRDEFIEATLKSVGPAREEDGCIGYEYLQSTEDENVIICLEQWEGLDQALAHTQTPHFIELSAVSAKALEDAKIRFFDASPSDELKAHFPPNYFE
ncbi:hypothetical protein FACS1894104_2530 [Actinomycetota bacterium]|nr:hypothetical protein FACS1894104_2530 [Actinomycetota bacterium]